MRTQRQTITDSEFTSLCLHQVTKSGKVGNLKTVTRNVLILTLLYDCGLRVAELVNLQISDLLFRDTPVANLTVRATIAKNHQERIIPLTAAARAAITAAEQNYWRAASTREDGYAFYAKKINKHITTRQLERLIHTWGIAAIGRPLHPHIFRHSFATRLMRKTNSRIVQQLLGHKHLSSTQIYTHPDLTDLTTAINS